MKNLVLSMFRYKSLSVLCLLLCFDNVVFSQNYEISFTTNNTQNDTIFLGYYFASKSYLSDTVVLKNGKGVFRSNRELPNGVYFLYSNGRLLFDFIIGDNKKFGIVADTTDFINLTKFIASPDNDVFLEYRRQLTDRTKKLQQLSDLYRNTTSDAEKSEIIAKQNTINRESLEYIDKLIEDNRHLYVSKIVESGIPVEARVPEPPRDEQGNITDQNFQYRWWRAHFFDNLDILDPDMLRTQSYDDKLFGYLTKVIPPYTDTICVEIDKILTKAQANDAVFRYIMSTLYNHYSNLAMEVIIDKGIVPENVFLHLAEKWYIPYATWGTEENKDNLKDLVKKRTPNLIGKHAPPIEMLKVLPPEHFKAAVLDTAIKYDVHAGRDISDFRKELKSKFTVLFFWDFTCGHCKQSIQDLFSVWEEYKDKGLQVITVQLYYADRKDKGRWIDFVNEKELFGTGWMNAWSPYSHKYRDMYNTASVPVMYLLDENFDIILRGNLKNSIGSETIKEFFDRQVSK